MRPGSMRPWNTVRKRSRDIWVRHSLLLISMCWEVMRLVKIRVSYEKLEELDQVLSLLGSGRNEPKNVKISAKRGGKYARAYMEIRFQDMENQTDVSKS